MKVNEKRINRGYKATKKTYLGAMKQAKKDGIPLSQIIEQSLFIYGQSGLWPSFDNIKLAVTYSPQTQKKLKSLLK